MEIKSCVFDIDGTLVPFGSTAPSQRTLATLRAAQKKGICVMIATGRALFAAKGVLGGFVPDYYVCCNGGMVANAAGTVVQRDDLTTEEMYALVDFCEDYDCALDFIFDDGYYAYVDYAFLKEHYGPFHSSLLYLHDGENQERHRQSMPYGCSVFLNEARRAQFSKKYAHLGLRFIPFHGDHCDVLRAGVNKAVTLTALLQKLGIGWEHTAAFGDGNNDVEMLEKAGLAVVLGNGTQSAKQAADVIAPDAADDGVAQALDEYIL